MRSATLLPLLGLLLALAACGGDGSPDASATLIPVQTQGPRPFLDIGPLACPAALLEGTLTADDEVGFVVEQPDGFASSVRWPHGYVARDAARRELLDGAGRVVAREGDHFSGGGGWHGDDAEGFTVCGEFEITPAP